MSHKEVRDGKLVDVDDLTGNVIDELKPDGPVTGPAVVTNLGNSPANPVGVVGPLEGGNTSGDPNQDLQTAKEAMAASTGRIPDHLKERQEELKNEIKENKANLSDKTQRQIETEGRAAADRDNEDARKVPHIGVNEPVDADKTAVREDGTVTTTGRPDRTAVYLHGNKVLVTIEEFEKYKNMVAELEQLQGDTGAADIPLNSPYYAKKQEIDAYVATLKR